MNDEATPQLEDDELGPVDLNEIAPDPLVDDEVTRLRAMINAKLEELKAEFGKVEDLTLDVALDEDVAGFLLEAEPRLQAVLASLNGKGRFTMHREPNGEFYILRTLRPREWRSEWVGILTGRDDLFKQYADDVLMAAMVYPSYDEADWDYEGAPKMHNPTGLTKSRLVGAFFNLELPEPNQPSAVEFSGDGLTQASTVARRTKPSL